jgi:hypothetical protein
MDKRLFYCLLFVLISLTANSQAERHDPRSVLSSFLENSFNGRYLGWTGNRNDSLRLVASDYYEKVKSLKKSFMIEQGDNCFFVKSYSLDSLQVINDYAFGYVTLDAITNGDVSDRLTIVPGKIQKTYLLITKNSNWYVLAETKYWYTSAKAYINWAEKYLSDKTRFEGPEYRDNVKNNLRDFKELIKIP